MNPPAPKKKTTSEPGILHDTIEFRKTLTSESDRACALMAGAYLDGKLEELLRSVLVQDSRVAKELFDQSKALGTFSSRIDMTYMLGLLNGQERRDLHLIRKIRNAFGHQAAPMDFGDSAISSQCKELALSVGLKRRPRALFTSAVMAILSGIDYAIVHSKHIAKRPDVAPEKLEKFRKEYSDAQEVFSAALDRSPEEAIAILKAQKARMVEAIKEAEKHYTKKPDRPASTAAEKS